MLERRWTSNKTKRGIGAEECNSEDPKRPLWKPNLHYQDAMPLEPLAAYSFTVYMYIIMGWIRLTTCALTCYVAFALSLQNKYMILSHNMTT